MLEKKRYFIAKQTLMYNEFKLKYKIIKLEISKWQYMKYNFFP